MELIKDLIYYVYDTDNNGVEKHGHKMIGRCLGSSRSMAKKGCDVSQRNGPATFICLYVSDRAEFNKNQEWCYVASDRKFRLATEEEIDWFLLCESEGQIMPKPTSTYKKTHELW